MTNIRKLSKSKQKRRSRRKTIKDSESFVVKISFTRHFGGRRQAVLLIKNYLTEVLERASFGDVHVNVKNVDVSFAMPEDAIPEFQLFEPFEEEDVMFNEYDCHEIIN